MNFPEHIAYLEKEIELLKRRSIVSGTYSHNRAHNLFTLADHPDIGTYLQASNPLLTTSSPTFLGINTKTINDNYGFDVEMFKHYSVLDDDSNKLSLYLYHYSRGNLNLTQYLY